MPGNAAPKLLFIPDAAGYARAERLVGPDPALIADELDLPAWVIEAWQRWMRRGCLAQRNFCCATRL